MTDALWLVLAVQMGLGGFDTLYHHELTERLAWRPSQVEELRLHGGRNLAYAALFATLGWCEPHGAAALALILLMVGEALVTLWDFVVEDRTRRLPATERVTHALLTLNYGVLLAWLFPLLHRWSDLPTALLAAYHGIWSWLCLAAALGVVSSGLRDLRAARRTRRLGKGNPAPLARALKRQHAILVTGGTGFIGSRLVAALVAAGHDVTVLTRNAARAVGLPAPLRIVTSLDQIADEARIDAIVNLAGDPIAEAPWSARKRHRMLRSRLKMTRGVLRLIGRLSRPPSVLVSGSAIGWYGLRADEWLDETARSTDCFSHALCARWERAAAPAAQAGVRVVHLRTGLVLAAEGGLLSRMLVPFELGLGGPFGTGRQWMSWIHRDDLVRLIVHAIATPGLVGPLNATAPAPVRNRTFAAALARALARPAILALPAAPLRFALGAFADELLLGGQRVVPVAALRSGFKFDFPDIDAAVNEIVGTPRGIKVRRPPARTAPAPIAPVVDP
jgi:uncharacterized protein (TIGR01777 family)